MRFLLDTDICVYAIKQHTTVLQRILSHRRTEVAISVITEAELRYGAAKSKAAAKTLRALEAFLLPFETIDFTSGHAEVYAGIRSKLELGGTPIGPLDTLIAAQAMADSLVLVTNNDREFTRIAGLRVENWTT